MSVPHPDHTAAAELVATAGRLQAAVDASAWRLAALAAGLPLAVGARAEARLGR